MEKKQSPVDENKILQSSGLKYSYPGQKALELPDLSCEPAGKLLITGQSGSGKTTLLHLISGLLRIQQGDVKLLGESLKGMSQSALDRFRGRHIGLVFQQARFISSLRVIDNVCAAQYFGTGKSDRQEAMRLLEALGIQSKAQGYTQGLSGGERQRLSIARALASKPEVVMADEPTSSLDDVHAEAVYHLLSTECSSRGASLIVVSHDQRLKDKFQNVVSL